MINTGFVYHKGEEKPKFGKRGDESIGYGWFKQPHMESVRSCRPGHRRRCSLAQGSAIGQRLLQSKSKRNDPLIRARGLALGKCAELRNRYVLGSRAVNILLCAVCLHRQGLHLTPAELNWSHCHIRAV